MNVARKSVYAMHCIMSYIDILLLEFVTQLQQMDAIRNETRTVQIENRVHFCQTKSD